MSIKTIDERIDQVRVILLGVQGQHDRELEAATEREDVLLETIKVLEEELAKYKK